MWRSMDSSLHLLASSWSGTFFVLEASDLLVLPSLSWRDLEYKIDRAKLHIDGCSA
jgi:hypothetical protein